MSLFKGLLIAVGMFVAGVAVTLAVVSRGSGGVSELIPVVPPTIALPLAIATTAPAMEPRVAIEGSFFFLRLDDARQLTAMGHHPDEVAYLQWRRELLNQGRVITLPGGAVVKVGRDIAPETPTQGPEHFYEALYYETHGFIAAYNLK